MDEQRILEEMERVLAAEDPRLAARLVSFGRPALSDALRTRRARAALMLMLLTVVAAVMLVVYTLGAVRLGTGTRPPHGSHPAASVPGSSSTSAAPLNGRPGSTPAP
jgi:hypothetical protein